MSRKRPLDYIPNPLPYFTTNSFSKIPRISPSYQSASGGARGIPAINRTQPPTIAESPPTTTQPPITTEPPSTTLPPPSTTEPPPNEPPQELGEAIDLPMPPSTGYTPPTTIPPPPPETQIPPTFTLGAPKPNRPPPTYAAVPGATTPSYQQPGT